MCAHYQGFMACAAFPDRIPQEILTGLYDHREPYQGDHGIRWEPLPDVFEVEPGEDSAEIGFRQPRRPKSASSKPTPTKTGQSRRPER